MGKTYVVYPGRFQPMGKHHTEVYRRLQKQFGEDVYIATSDSVNSRKNPLGYDQKRKIAERLGIPQNKMFKCDQPYSIEHTTQGLSQLIGQPLNPEEDVLVYVYGQKDLGRLSFFKPDGSPGIFQAYDQSKVRPYKEHAYVYITPTIEIEFNGKPLSGTVLRDYLRQADKTQFQNVMGFYDPEIHQTLQHTKPLEESKVESSSKFDRVKYYKEYLTNVLPKDFKINVEHNDITIKL